jgi:hypothetical protein
MSPKSTPPPKRVFVSTDPESKIYTTTEYDKFKRMPGNRPVRFGHVQNIKAKIEEHDLKVPIVINKTFEIVDGQHTLEARRELALPVYYRFGEKMDLHDVQTLNNTTLQWTNEDYAGSFIELGNKHYKTYRAFRKKYTFPHEVAVILLTGRDMRESRKLFREGEFRVADIADAEKKAAMFAQLKDYTSGYRQDVFVKAMLIALGRVGFNFDKFMERAKEHKHMFQYWPKIDQNLLMIEEIFNSGTTKKVPIRYGTDAAKLAAKEARQKERSSKPEAADKKSGGEVGNGPATGRTQKVAKGTTAVSPH